MVVEARCNIKLSGGGRPVFLSQTFEFPPEVGDTVVIERGGEPLLCRVESRLIASYESGLPRFLLRLGEIPPAEVTGEFHEEGGETDA